MTKEKVKDLILSVLILIISFVFYLQTKTLTPPADIFPKVVIMILSVLGTILLIKTLFIRKNDNDEEMQDEINQKKKWISITSLIGYVILMPILGFYTTSVIFLISLSLYLAGEKVTIKRILKSMIVSLSVVCILYIGFSLFLKIPVPSGFLI